MIELTYQLKCKDCYSGIELKFVVDHKKLENTKNILFDDVSDSKCLECGGKIALYDRNNLMGECEVMI